MAGWTDDELISAIDREWKTAFQNKSCLSIFKGQNIGDIGVKKWLHRKLDDIPHAGLALAQYVPTIAKLNAEGYGDWVYTVGEEIAASESDWKGYVRSGIDKEGVKLIGEKTGETASYCLWRGADLNGNAPTLQFNYIFDPGAGVGTYERPLIISHATYGGWNTFATKSQNCTELIAQLVAKGFNPASTVVFYPRIAYGAMNRHGGAAEPNAFELFKEQGIMGIEEMPDRYMHTLAGAAPTAILFDLYAIDLNEVDIGYTLEEETTVIPPNKKEGRRVGKIQGECWFIPWLMPRLWADDGKIYKSVSRITAIAP